MWLYLLPPIYGYPFLTGMDLRYRQGRGVSQDWGREFENGHHAPGPCVE